MLIRLLFAGLVVSGCCCNCGPKKESYVSDVPATMKAAKALEKPPKVTVTVERVTKTRTGGGACGHSPICIVLLPVLLYEAAFPEKYDVVSVKEDGKEIFGATYTTDGDLIHGLKELDAAAP